MLREPRPPMPPIPPISNNDSKMSNGLLKSCVKQLECAKGNFAE
ncbi:hypothetical protein Hanom_Chr11g01001341 [Helianthus anomalus]